MDWRYLATGTVCLGDPVVDPVIQYLYRLLGAWEAKYCCKILNDVVDPGWPSPSALPLGDVITILHVMRRAPALRVTAVFDVTCCSTGDGWLEVVVCDPSAILVLS